MKYNTLDILLNSLNKSLKPETIQVISTDTDFKINKSIPEAKYTQLTPHELNEHRTSEEKYDLAVGLFPIGMPTQQFGTNKLPVNWINILRLTESISEDGVGVFWIEPSAFNKSKFSTLKNLLESSGFHIKAILNTPPNILSQTAIRPLIVIIDKYKSQNIFIAELKENSIAKTIHNYSNNIYTNDLYLGIKYHINNFTSFGKIESEIELDKIDTQYTTYNQKKLKDLADDIKIANDADSFTGNSVFIPRYLNIKSEIEFSKIKTHKNFYHIELKDIISNKYLKLYLDSGLGKLNLKQHSIGSTLSTISLHELKKIQIPLPPVDEQDQIVKISKKIELISSRAKDLAQQISLNPTTSPDLIDKIDKILTTLESDTYEEKILTLIAQGESKTVEFKESISLDIKTGKKAKYLRDVILKTISAFLNTEGGTLLVGVKDNGFITGVDNEIKSFFKNSDDKFLLHISNLMKKFDGSHYSFIDYKIKSIQNKKIAVFTCLKSSTPCFVGEDFYIRTNPASEKLTGKDLIGYVKNHFEN